MLFFCPKKKYLRQQGWCEESPGIWTVAPAGIDRRTKADKPVGRDKQIIAAVMLCAELEAVLKDGAGIDAQAGVIRPAEHDLAKARGPAKPGHRAAIAGNSRH